MLVSDNPLRNKDFSFLLKLSLLNFFQVSSKRDMNNGEESPKPVLQDKDFILDCLCWHNEYRARHGAPALTVSPEVSRPMSVALMCIRSFVSLCQRKSFPCVRSFI